MKKFLIFLVLMFCPAHALEEGNLDYLNLSFFEKFNDEFLIQNIMTAYENNHDLKAATIKVREAQRLVKMSFANELPEFGFQGYLGRTFKSSDELFGDVKIPDYTQNHFLFPLSMNYEIDIWGENRLKTKSKQKQFETIKQDEKSAYIYITSALAADYYNLIRVDKLISFQKDLIKVQNEILNSVKRQYELGVATLSDINSEEKNLTFMTEEIEKLNEKQDVLKSQISVILADNSFSDIKRENFDKLNVALKTPEFVDVKILENRPDRLKSEYNLEKAGIDIKIAKKDLLPKFILNGNVGFNFYSHSSPHNFLLNAGIVPVWDVFTGGKKLQILKLNKDRYEVAIENYEKTILTSMQETNDALYSLKTAEKIENIVQQRLNSDIKEGNFVKTKEIAGVADNLDLLRQRKKILITEKQLVLAKINKIISDINLYQALGGVDFTENVNL